ncbi:MAG: methylated-DNA--[protein]-cysteine S-methyltransferase [Raoultibacter sp.]|jgi:methylated-DNA-[protein]-cysteine S-methyltransferase
MNVPSLSYFVYRTPVGSVSIASDGSSITHVLLGEHTLPGTQKACEITNRAAQELQEYFAGKRFSFDLPLNPKGSDFQKQVWAALQNIPYGETRSYADVAKAIGNPQAQRAVGSANNKNPIHILIPCHRVITSDGKLGGYAAGVTTKQFLLDLERNAQKA